MGEFFDLHPEPAAVARRNLAWDLRKGLCSTSEFAALGGLRSVRFDPAGVAYAIMTAASITDPWAPLPAAVHAV